MYGERGIKDFRHVFGKIVALGDFVRPQRADGLKKLGDLFYGYAAEAVVLLGSAEPRDELHVVSDQNNVVDIKLRQVLVAEDRPEVLLHDGTEILRLVLNGVKHVVQLQRADGHILGINHCASVVNGRADCAGADKREE